VGTDATPLDRYPKNLVSIQLVSPASGDEEVSGHERAFRWVSIQLVSPASGDGSEWTRTGFSMGFPFN